MRDGGSGSGSRGGSLTIQEGLKPFAHYDIQRLKGGSLESWITVGAWFERSGPQTPLNTMCIYINNIFFAWLTYIYGAANKYYSSAGHYDQKNKKTNCQIKFLAVTIKQRIKLVPQNFLCKAVLM